MTADEYLHNILRREAVDTGISSPVRGVQTVIHPIIQEWATTQLVSLSPSGSFAKGTANSSGTDIELFISLKHDTQQTLKEIYCRLHTRMTDKGCAPKHQNVSINVKVNGYRVNLVPAKRQTAYGEDQRGRMAGRALHPARPCGGTAEHLGGAASLSAYTGPTEKRDMPSKSSSSSRAPFLTESTCPPTYDTRSRRSWLGMPGCGRSGSSGHWHATMPLPAYGRARPDGGGVEAPEGTALYREVVMHGIRFHLPS